MTQKSNTEITQIRLLIPRQWVQELDTLAATRFVTRLGLIRLFLRARIDQELAQANEQSKLREKNRQTKARLDSWLDDKLK